MSRIPFQENYGNVVALLPDGRVEFFRSPSKTIIQEINQGIRAFDPKEFDSLVNLNPELPRDRLHLAAPAIAFIELTNLCNLKCKHCYAFSGPKEKRKNELSLEEIKGVLDKFDEIGVLQVFLTGGEVFTHPNAVEIISHARSKKFSTQIFTNGLLIREEHLQQIPKGTSFFISFDTASPDRTVRGKMDYPLLKQRFDWMAKYGHVVRTAVSVHSHNIDDVYGIFEWCAENGYPRPQWLETNPVGRALIHPGILIPKSEIDRVMEVYERCMDRFSTAPEIRDEPPTKGYEMRSIDTIKFCQRLERATEMEKCGRTLVYINSGGDVYPCSNCMSNRSYHAGNLRENGFSEIWKDGFSEFRDFRFSDFKSCGSCAVQKTGIWCQFRCPPLAQNISRDPNGCGATEYLREFMMRADQYWKNRSSKGMRLLMKAEVE